MKKNLSENLLALCIPILFISCEKTERPITGGGSVNNGQFTIKGRFYQNCNRQPLVNTAFIFWQPGVSGHGLGTATTDANGKFSIFYTPINGATALTEHLFYTVSKRSEIG